MKFAISVAIVLGSLGTTAEGQSLWRHADPSLSNLVADTAARHVGDLVTILIRETTDVANRDQRQLGKATDASFNFDFNAAGDLGSGAGAFDISKASDRNFDGNSQFSVEQDFTDQITAQVIDVLPNGNLVLGAAPAAIGGRRNENARRIGNCTGGRCEPPQHGPFPSRGSIQNLLRRRRA